MKHALFALALLPCPALAETCAEVADSSDALAALIAQAQNAPDEAAGRAASDKMWDIWAKAPDAHAQDMLDEAMARREMYDYAGAMKAADALVAYCPDYAEGYNQRAFVHFLRQDYAAALPDLARTLELNPQHVAALTGQALTLMALERPGEAALSLRAALDLNPWLGERSLLPVLEAAEEEL
jgi:tetratricopeptide (TPR) repeat protein